MNAVYHINEEKHRVKYLCLASLNKYSKQIVAHVSKDKYGKVSSTNQNSVALTITFDFPLV